VVAPLFFIIALLAERAGGSEDIRDMGGIAMRAPVLAASFLIVAMASLAIPGSGNFVGEFMILLGVFNTKIVISIVAFAGVIMAAVYMLRVFIRSVHNRTGPHVASRELRLLDGLVLGPLMAAIIFFALYPQFELHRAERAVVGSIAAAQAYAGPVGVAQNRAAPSRTAHVSSKPAPMVAPGRQAAAIATKDNAVTVSLR
jgi:NADH-quinone oxidoreductase subunit M